MKKTKTLLALALSLLLAGMFLACSGGEDSSSYSMETMPDEYRVSLPSSLSSTSGGRLVTLHSEGTNIESLGYKQLQDAINAVEERNNQTAVFFVLADLAIKELGGPSAFTTSFRSNLSFTISQEIYNKIVDLGGKPPEGVAAGQSFTMPMFQYVAKADFGKPEILPPDSKLAEQVDKMKQLYDYLFLLIVPVQQPEGPPIPRRVYLFWNMAKTKVRVATMEKWIVQQVSDENRVFTDMIFENRPDGKFQSILYAWSAPPFIWTNNQWTLVSSADAGFRDVDIHSVVVQEIDRSKRGVMVDFFQKKRQAQGGDPPSSMEIYEHKVHGYADNFGGFVTSTFQHENTDTNANSFGALETFKYQEQFNGNGTLLAARKLNSEGQWDLIYGTTWQDPAQQSTYATHRKDFQIKQEAFQGENGTKQVILQNMANDTLIEIKLPATFIATAGENKFVVAQDGQSVLGTAGWANIIGFASIFDDEYQFLKDTFGADDVRIMVILRGVEPSSIPAMDLHLVSSETNGKIEKTSATNDLLLETSDPLVYQAN